MHQTDEIRGSGCELAMASQWTIHQLPLGPLGLVGHGGRLFPKGIRSAFGNSGGERPWEPKLCSLIPFDEFLIIPYNSFFKHSNSMVSKLKHHLHHHVWSQQGGHMRSASVAGYKDGDFNRELCPDPLSCARNCHLEGNSQESRRGPYFRVMGSIFLGKTW